MSKLNFLVKDILIDHYFFTDKAGDRRIEALYYSFFKFQHG